MTIMKYTDDNMTVCMTELKLSRKSVNPRNSILLLELQALRKYGISFEMYIEIIKANKLIIT